MAGKPAHPPVVDLMGDWESIKHEVRALVYRDAVATCSCTQICVHDHMLPAFVLMRSLPIMFLPAGAGVFRPPTSAVATLGLRGAGSAGLNMLLQRA